MGSDQKTHLVRVSNQLSPHEALAGITRQDIANTVLYKRIQELKVQEDNLLSDLNLKNELLQQMAEDWWKTWRQSMIECAILKMAPIIDAIGCGEAKIDDCITNGEAVSTQYGLVHIQSEYETKLTSLPMIANSILAERGILSPILCLYEHDQKLMIEINVLSTELPKGNFGEIRKWCGNQIMYDIVRMMVRIEPKTVQIPEILIEQSKHAQQAWASYNRIKDEIVRVQSSGPAIHAAITENALEAAGCGNVLKELMDHLR